MWEIILGFALLALALLASRAGREYGKRGMRYTVGICAAAIDQAVRKNSNKERIVGLLRERELGNAGIREELGVSRQSVTRYLDELEQEGRVEQVGSAGQSVTYRLK